MVGTVLPHILAGTVVYLQAFVLVAHGHGQDMTVMPIAPPEIPEEKCERITDVPICADMPWNYTLFPNLRDHRNLNSFGSSSNSIAQGPSLSFFSQFTHLFALMSIPLECFAHKNVCVCM